MATYTKFNQFVDDLVKGVHKFQSDTIKVALTNSAPSAATDAVFADISEISSGNGYTAGGAASGITVSVASGVAKVTADDVVFTATGSVGPFRYIVIYNDTPTSPADPLIGFADFGSSVTLASGQTFTVDFDGTNGLFTVT